MQDCKWAERRCGEDRRKNQTPSVRLVSLLGRRGIPRREADREGCFAIDVYGAKTLVVILLILSLSVMDALLTLYLLGQGAVEVNPVMAFFLDFGPFAFFGAKYLFTSLAVMLILINSRAFVLGTRVRAKVFLPVFAVPFALVVKWQLYLLFFVV
jgi:hypothetical protein